MADVKKSKLNNKLNSKLKLTPEEKLNLVKNFAEEIISEDELLEIFKEQENSNKEFVAYDGFEPSGQIHIAQGILKALIVNKLTSFGFKYKFYIADWFAYLNNKLGGDLEKIRTTGKYFIEVWKASGMNLENVEFIWSSDLIKDPKYWGIVLQLSKYATIQRVMRCSQIMGREESTSNPSSQILYPLMQAADMVYMKVDVAQLGLDQRKVNMLAREIFPKLGYKKPIAVHHHMLLGLKFKSAEGMNPIDKKIALKMSKSNPDSAIFMTDTEEEIYKKFKKAYCPEGITELNPVLDYAKYIVFEKYDKIVIKRSEKFGGNLEIKGYEELEKLFREKKIHPLDLKNSIAYYVNEILKPVREHFLKDEKAKELLKKVRSFRITK